MTFSMLSKCAVVLLMFRCCLPGQPAASHLTLRVEASAELPMLDLELMQRDLVGEFASGSTALRTVLYYDAPARVLRVRTFIASTDTPFNTPLWYVQEHQLEYFRIDVSEVTMTREGRFVLNGILSPGASAAYHQAPERTPATFTADFLNGTLVSASLRFGNGHGQDYRFGSGMARLEALPNQSPVAVAGRDVETATAEIRFDGRSSYDPDGEELDYKWHVTQGAAALRGCETATPTIVPSQGAGLYELRLTVTDSRGAASQSFVRINYVGR